MDYRHTILSVEYLTLDWIQTDSIHGGVALGVGFLLGVITGMFLVRRLYRRYAECHLREFTLADLFTTEISAIDWNPFHVNTMPPQDGHMANTERVLRVLIANNGRIRQSDIVAETGWSETKVSRLLTRMERDGDISRMNVGRTKLVFLGAFRRGTDDQSTPRRERPDP